MTLILRSTLIAFQLPQAPVMASCAPFEKALADESVSVSVHTRDHILYPSERLSTSIVFVNRGISAIDIPSGGAVVEPLTRRPNREGKYTYVSIVPPSIRNRNGCVFKSRILAPSTKFENRFESASSPLFPRERTTSSLSFARRDLGKNAFELTLSSFPFRGTYVVEMPEIVDYACVSTSETQCCVLMIVTFKDSAWLISGAKVVLNTDYPRLLATLDSHGPLQAMEALGWAPERILQVDKDVRFSASRQRQVLPIGETALVSPGTFAPIAEVQKKVISIRQSALPATQ